jgi:hypothetical protein
MDTKASNPSLDLLASLAIESDALHQPEIDAFIARNREALAESLLRSYEEIARGEVSTPTIDDIVSAGFARRAAAGRPTSRLV